MGLFIKRLLLGVAPLLALSSCHSGVQDFCAQATSPVYQSSIAALSVWKGAEPVDRKIASNPESDARRGFPEHEKDHWLDWSENELKKVQAALDWLNENRASVPREDELRLALTQAANEFVAFHGYCLQGNVERMIATLDRVEALRAANLSGFCATSNDQAR